MRTVERKSGLIQHLMGMTVRRLRPSPLKLFFGTLIPPLVVLAFAFYLWHASGRWPVFTVAVIACAWFGGFESGVAATLISTALMWWFFVPPVHVIFKPGNTHYFAALVFVCTGIAVELM